MNSKIIRAALHRNWFCIVILVASSSAMGFEMGPLNQYLDQGSSNGWTLQDDDGSVLLNNSSAPGDITYYYVNAFEDEGRRTIETHVSVKSQDGGRAGLLYGFLQDPRSYFLYTADGHGEVALHFFGPEGFVQIAAYPIDEGEVTLTIQEQDNSITLFANHEQLQVLTDGRLGIGGVGIVAANIGLFRLSDFQIYTDSVESQNTPPVDNGDHSKPLMTSQGPSSAQCSEGMTFQEQKDPQSGMVTMYSPMPDGWKFVARNPENLYISGPGVNIYSYGAGSFVWGKTPTANQSARGQNARRVVQPLPLKDYLDQEITPKMRSNGFQLANVENLPEIESFWELFSMSMPQLGNVRTYEALGSEWKSADGELIYKLLTLTQVENAEFVAWDVRASDVHTTNENYEIARNNYICAYANTQVNPDWQIRMNNELIANIEKNTAKVNNMMAQSATAHAQRMNSIAQRGASTKAIGDTYSEILDISHTGYLKRSDMISAGQAKSADYAAGRSVIFSPNTGERYKVESGNKHYWINSRGEYFGTDNPNLDPRTDNRFSDSVWTNTVIQH